MRGVVATDGLIGTFTDLDDPALDANRCFLYHVIGGGTGDWDVPVGGMGAVTGELARAAREAGAELVTGAEVLAVDPDGRVRYALDGAEHVIDAGTVLANVAPAVLDRLLSAGATDAAARRADEASAAGAADGAVAPRDQRPFRPNDPIPVPPVVRERLRRLAEPRAPRSR